MSPAPSRDQIAARYLDQLRVRLYPYQEEALLAWFAGREGVLVCAPTGMGKTLIAEAAVFEALHSGTTAYYTTPLIALTEQKYRDLQNLAGMWGFFPDDVGLVTGNRRENPNARILVVVAEILFNRLLHREAFDFSRLSAVVMDEFHSFNDPERGVVWELSLALLPPHVRTLLLSATVGSAREFVQWLRAATGRRLELVEADERRVPLVFRWVGDRLLNEQIEEMAQGDEPSRFTPALVFCFNREECWRIADQLRGKRILPAGQQAQLSEELNRFDWSQGAGPKLKQLLLRGVGVHHAGVLPKYRRIVEDLFQRKLLSVTVCTETLSAGINLPARSVVLPRILKGPPGARKILEPSTAHQIFGRAGRPQYDQRGYVFVLAHEDDVKIARWKQKYDQIPEGTKDPALLKAKRALKRKMPRRRETEQYWTEAQFEKLRASRPAKLASRGPLPWRLLAYMLEASPEVQPIRSLVAKRLMDRRRQEAGERELDRMLLTLWRAGYVVLEPEPPPREQTQQCPAGQPPGPAPYKPIFAYPAPQLHNLLLFRSVNPLYGMFLVNHLGIANRQERIQAMESVLDMPCSIGRWVRVPGHDQMPPGPLAITRLDPQLLSLGLATADELTRAPEDQGDRGRRRGALQEPPKRVLTLAEKLRRLFDYDFPGVHDLRTQPVWAAGELLQFAEDFNKYVITKGLQKQEGIVFRHLLRLILLLKEFLQFVPPDTRQSEWRSDLEDLGARFTESCRRVDPTSTDRALRQAALDPSGGLEAI
ncbi:MAG: DEAD/DEAH box helicase [Thermoguttaceae bacterium]